MKKKRVRHLPFPTIRVAGQRNKKKQYRYGQKGGWMGRWGAQQAGVGYENDTQEDATSKHAPALLSHARTPSRIRQERIPPQTGSRDGPQVHAQQQQLVVTV